jgi:hypothetical protein
MKPGTASWSRVTWVASVAMILPRTGKVFWGRFEAEEEGVWRQPLKGMREARRRRELQDFNNLRGTWRLLHR